VAEDDVFDIRLCSVPATGLEVGPHMCVFLVSSPTKPLRKVRPLAIRGSFAGTLGVVLFPVPFVDVISRMARGKPGRVIAGTFIFAGLLRNVR